MDNNPQQVELYQRLQAFSFDQLDTQLPFHKRVAKENGWSLAFAQRVIEEYKKFAFLAVVAGHPVSPSDQVDQVWHLHLTYSRSYWQEFCPQVLQHPFHHEPTRGGSSERVKLNDWYHRTLASYEHFFGEVPPTDIWPSATIRFGQDLRFVRVNTEQNWVVPKPTLPSLRLNQATLFPLVFTLALTIAGCQAIAALPNPLNFTGSEFLIFYAVVDAIAILLAFRLRKWLHLPNGDPVQRSMSLDAYETAYLVDGVRRVVDTAIASLVQQGHVTVQSETRSLSLSDPAVQVSHPVERAVAAAIKSDGRVGTIRVRTVVVEAMDAIRDRLRQLGLLLSQSQALQVRLYPTLLIAAVLGLGITKILVGISRGKPVGYLIALCVLTAIFAGFAFQAPEPRSRYGDRVLASLRDRARPHRGRRYTTLDPELPLACALFGTVIFADSELADLKTLFTPPISSSSSNVVSSGGGCSGGGGDSGCGGDGGCGGGCGGCGGCGG